MQPLMSPLLTTAEEALNLQQTNLVVHLCQACHCLMKLISEKLLYNMGSSSLSRLARFCIQHVGTCYSRAFQHDSMLTAARVALTPRVLLPLSAPHF